MSFNREQIAYMETLAQMPADTKCWCGWYSVRECKVIECKKSDLGLTCADKLAAACGECGNVPWEPGEKINHKAGCSRSTT